MSAEQQELLAGVQEKLQRLLQACDGMRAERDALRESLLQQDTTVLRLNATIAELEAKNKKLQLADAFKVSSEDTHDARLKIGRLVREIDKCMALLNK